MKWQTLNVNNADLYDVYQQKYGKTSDYQKAQKIMYSHPEIKASLGVALSWMNIKSGDIILDIGVNNGYELNLIEEHYGTQLMNQISVIGFDLAEDVLVEACDLFTCVKRFNFKFIKGDIREFSGVDILTKEIHTVDDNSIDIVVALTSLQSSSLVDQFDVFMDELVAKIKKDGRLFIAVPNCHVDDSNSVVKGMFDATTQKIDAGLADIFIKRLEIKLSKHGFHFKQIGEFYHFLYFTR